MSKKSERWRHRWTIPAGAHVLTLKGRLKDWGDWKASINESDIVGPKYMGAMYLDGFYRMVFIHNKRYVATFKKELKRRW